MVPDEELERARGILRDAGIGNEIRSR
jgi:hypothetical protein